MGLYSRNLAEIAKKNYDTWSRNKIKVVQKKFHTSTSIIEIEKWPKKQINNFKNLKNPIFKKREHMGFANRL